MIHTKKMILVPYDSSCCTTSPKTVQTPGTVISRLDEEMSNILNSNQFQDDREKWLQYRQTLQRYLNLSHQPINDKIEPTSSVGEEVESKITDKVILESVPKSFRGKAKLFLGYARREGKMFWNNNGEVTIDGQLVKGSNIIDIVNDAVRLRKTFHAEGRSQVSRALRNAGVPRTAVGNINFWSDGTFVTDNSYRDMSGIAAVSSSSSSPGSSSGGSVVEPMRTPIQATIRASVLPSNSANVSRELGLSKPRVRLQSTIKTPLTFQPQKRLRSEKASVSIRKRGRIFDPNKQGSKTWQRMDWN